MESNPLQGVIDRLDALTRGRPLQPRQQQTGTRDYALEILAAEIEEYRTRTFENFINLNVSVRPVQSARALGTVDGIQVGWDRYFFQQWNTEGKLIAVCALNNGKVKIKLGQRWCTLDQYLGQLEPQHIWDAPDGSEAKRHMWAQQFEWWKANGKKFRFLDLPAEIREAIYGCVIGSEVVVESVYKTSAKGLVYPPRPAFYGILRSSKQVYNEASDILYARTPFVVETSKGLRSLLLKGVRHQKVRILELSLSHIDFLEFFGFETNGIISRATSRQMPAFLGMNLQQLILDIAPPSEITKGYWVDGACQKQTVDWIIESASPFVLRFPAELTGFVKTSSRALWDRLAHEENERFKLWQKHNVIGGHEAGTKQEYYEQLDEEEGGVLLDDDAREAKEAQAAAVKDVPARCFCKTRCCYTVWTEDD